MPRPPDPAVAFDHQAAAQLADRLETLARLLRQAERDHAEGVAAATKDWRGFTRSWFDGAAHDVATSLHRAAADVARAAASVRNATAVA